jgi:F-type H+-transporting ATPase subunit gamma
MQMVSASRLKRARIALENGKPYIEAVKHSLSKAVVSSAELSEMAKMMLGENIDNSNSVLILAFGSDRGLCGAFNHATTKIMQDIIYSYEEVKIIAIGKKIMDFVNLHYSDFLRSEYMYYEMTDDIIYEIADDIIDMILSGVISSCYLCFNNFKNVISQEPTSRSIIPFQIEDNANEVELVSDDLLNYLLRSYIISEIKNALLNSSASEEAARTTAMDNATRNAGDLIDELTLVLNRKRQAAITEELIEIISGAEAL